MNVYRHGRFWWMRYQENGKYTYLSLKTDDRTEADKKAAAINAMRHANKVLRIVSNSAQAPVPSFSWAAERWPHLNPKERMAVLFSMHNGCCVYCHREVTIPLARNRRFAPRTAVLDHRIPVAGGGPDSIENLVLCCYECNMRKHDGAVV